MCKEIQQEKKIDAREILVFKFAYVIDLRDVSYSSETLNKPILTHVSTLPLAIHLII